MEYYTQYNIEKRQAIFDDPQILECTELLWNIVVSKKKTREFSKGKKKVK